MGRGALLPGSAPASRADFCLLILGDDGTLCCNDKDAAPTAVQTSSSCTYIDSLLPAAALQPRTLLSITGTFQEAFLSVARHHRHLLPARKVAGLPHLRAMGFAPLLAGVDPRPIFPLVDSWIPLLRDVCMGKSLQPLLQFVAEE